MQKGDRVRFRPTHHKELLLTGTIVGGDDRNSVEIQSDEANGSVSRLYVAHEADVEILKEGDDAQTQTQEQESQEESGALEEDGEIYSPPDEGDTPSSEKVTHIRRKKRA